MNTLAFEGLLNELHQESSEIKASALLSGDGIMVASHLPNNVSEDKLAAMSAAMLSVGERMVADLLDGITERVMVQSNVGYIIVTAVSTEMLLAVVATPDAKLGMVFHDIRNLARNLQILEYAVA